MKDVVSRGVLIDVVDGDQDFYYRRYAAEWMRILPSNGFDHPIFAMAEFSCWNYGRFRYFKIYYFSGRSADEIRVVPMFRPHL